MKHAPICILGNSIAAVSFIETLRHKGNKEDIIVLSKEPFPAYGRPLISYLLAHKIQKNNIFLRPPDFYIKNNVHFYPGTSVLDVNLSKSLCITNHGKQISFEKLLISTGGKPYIPPIEGIEKTSNVFTFTTLDDALQIDSALENVRNVVILGAGLIGLKAAEALSCRNKNISIVELSDRVLPSVLDSRGSDLFQKRMEEDGITFHFQQTIKKVYQQNGSISNVLLSNKKTLPCDLLIIAVGVRPNTDFLEDRILSKHKAIRVNKYMKTQVDDIYAAGDVSESYDLLYNTVRHMPLWPNAYWQGHFAALSVAGIPFNFYGHVSMNSIAYKDIPMMSAGIVEDPELPIESFEIVNENSYRRFNFQNERLVGLLFVGDVEDKGVLAHLLKHQDIVSQIKQKIYNKDFSFLDYPLKYQMHHLQKAHGKNEC